MIQTQEENGRNASWPERALSPPLVSFLHMGSFCFLPRHPSGSALKTTRRRHRRGAALCPGYGYPPDKQKREKATRTVLEQAEALAADWAA